MSDATGFDTGSKYAGKLQSALDALKLLAGLRGAGDKVAIEQYERALRDFFGLKDLLTEKLPGPIADAIGEAFDFATAILDFIDKQIKPKAIRQNVERLKQGFSTDLRHGVPFGPRWLDPPKRKKKKGGP